MDRRNTISNTFIVAGGLCLVCSMLVSAAAVGLKKYQLYNVEIDRKRNILAAGFSSQQFESLFGVRGASQLSAAQVQEIFAQRIEDRIVDLDTGEEVTDQFAEGAADEAARKKMIDQYDQLQAASSKEPSLADQLERATDVAGIAWREKRSHVYILRNPDTGETEAYILPVRGQGLWSTLKGFLAVRPDLQTVAGLTFYEHGETPGLGGEVDNPAWKAKWPDKKIFADDGSIGLHLVKGVGVGPYEIDGLAGATITSRGVTNLVQYWLGPNGFGPFLDRMRAQSGSTAQFHSGESRG